MDTKACQRCGETIYKKPVTRKGYQGQDWVEIVWEDHGIEDCIKHLRFLIDDIGSRRIV